MTEQESPVLIVDSNVERARRFASFVQFLGYPTHTASTIPAMSAAIDELSSVLAVFVAAGADEAAVTLVDAPVRSAASGSGRPTRLWSPPFACQRLRVLTV